MTTTDPSTYRPLADYLAALPAETATVTLTISEIEAIIGAPVPRAARTAPFWTNVRVVPPPTWLRAGWWVQGVRRVPHGERAVTFVRAVATDRPAAGSG
jgi:hypothetical protein